MNSTVKQVVFWLVIVLVRSPALAGGPRERPRRQRTRRSIFRNFISEVNREQGCRTSASPVRKSTVLTATKRALSTPSCLPNYIDMYKMLQDKGVSVTVKDTSGGSYGTC